MDNLDIESIKVAVAVRVGRSAAGLSQQELADMIGISKVTLARVETLESKLKAEFYMKAIKIFRDMGVEMDTMLSDGIKVNVSPKALQLALGKLQDESKRRTDRKSAKK